MNSGRWSQEALEEWREHPVTLRLLGALRREAEIRREWMSTDWWNGSPPAEAERLGLRIFFEALERLETASADDVTEMEKWIEEHERSGGPETP